MDGRREHTEIVPSECSQAAAPRVGAESGPSLQGLVLGQHQMSRATPSPSLGSQQYWNEVRLGGSFRQRELAM